MQPAEVTKPKKGSYRVRPMRDALVLGLIVFGAALASNGWLDLRSFHGLGLSLLIASIVGLVTFNSRSKELADFDEKNRMTAAMALSERRFRDIAESVGEYIWDLDESGRYTYISDRFESLLGYKPSDLIGSKPDRLFHPDDRDQTVARLDRLRQAGEPFRNLEHRKLTRSGTTVWISISGAPVKDKNGRVTGYRGVGLDITNRKNSEEQLKSSKEAAEAADRAKSEFLAVMSHEIRTPMNGVIGFTNLLANTRLDEQQRDFVETIQQSGEALLVLINDILDFSKIESGHLQLECRSFRVRDCLFGVLNLTAQAASRKDLELLGEIEEDVPEIVAGDMARLRQVLLNLVGNAIKFTQQGRVVVHVSASIPARSGTYTHILRFSVRDTGLGIPPDRIPALFQAFRQADSSTTRRFGGTGLGLAICKRLVELMGGEITVESAPDEGSEFAFTIPFNESDAAALDGADSPADKFLRTGKRVLVAGGDGQTRKSVCTNLRQWGIDPVEAPDSSAASTILDREIDLDLAIINENGQAGAGEMLANHILQHRETGGLPMILLSSSRAQSTGDSEEPPFIAVLSKPTPTDILFEAVSQILSQPRSNTPSAIARVRKSFDNSFSSQHPCRILLAEDNPVNQRVALLMLERLGYKADAVGNGADAVAATADDDYDLVIMDLQMPELDGLEATREIRAREEADDNRRHIQIIALTADATQGDRERALNAGMDGYMTKPIRPESLKEAVGSASLHASRAAART